MATYLYDVHIKMKENPQNIQTNVCNLHKEFYLEIQMQNKILDYFHVTTETAAPSDLSKAGLLLGEL